MTATQPKKAPLKTPANTDTVLTAHKVMNHAPQHWRAHTKSQIRNILLQLGIFVGLPVFIATLYFGFIAADQYQTEAHISVRSAQGSSVSTLFGSIMGASGMGQSVQDTKSIADYLGSHDAVASLDKSINLHGIFRHPNADFISRLPENSTFETLFKHYKKNIDVVFDTGAGTVVVKSRAYTPEDSQRLTTEIISLSENVVNNFNKRAQRDALRIAQEELGKAKNYLTDANSNIVNFRLTHKEIDPLNKSGSILGIITKLESEHTTAKTHLAEISTYMTEENTEVRMLNRRIDALKKQIEQEQKRLTGKGDTFTQRLSEYEKLLMEKELANQAYTSALISLENARMEAQRQQSYVIPIVEPHLPQSAEFPQRTRRIILVLLTSLLIFGIGKLIVSGIKDHVMH